MNIKMGISYSAFIQQVLSKVINENCMIRGNKIIHKIPFEKQIKKIGWERHHLIFFRKKIFELNYHTVLFEFDINVEVGKIIIYANEEFNIEDAIELIDKINSRLIELKLMKSKEDGIFTIEIGLDIQPEDYILWKQINNI